MGLRINAAVTEFKPKEIEYMVYEKVGVIEISDEEFEILRETSFMDCYIEESMIDQINYRNIRNRDETDIFLSEIKNDARLADLNQKIDVFLNKHEEIFLSSMIHELIVYTKAVKKKRVIWHPSKKVDMLEDGKWLLYGLNLLETKGVKIDALLFDDTIKQYEIGESEDIEKVISEDKTKYVKEIEQLIKENKIPDEYKEIVGFIKTHMAQNVTYIAEE